jgi:protein-S-isoprenylcysteine O-methyltransferase Ste14
MGAAWRIGIDQKGTSKLVQSGPYRRIRHPIYGFQMTMLIGAALLLPTWISFAILVIHYVCATIKASDEEKHLTGVFGSEYRDYMKRTGRFLPGRG